MDFCKLRKKIPGKEQKSYWYHQKRKCNLLDPLALDPLEPQDPGSDNGGQPRYLPAFKTQWTNFGGEIKGANFNFKRAAHRKRERGLGNNTREQVHFWGQRGCFTPAFVLCICNRSASAFFNMRFSSRFFFWKQCLPHCYIYLPWPPPKYCHNHSIATANHIIP